MHVDTHPPRQPGQLMLPGSVHPTAAADRLLTAAEPSRLSGLGRYMKKPLLTCSDMEWS